MLRAERRLDGRHLQLLAVPAVGSIGQIGFVIGRQHLSRAVDRNHARRLFREALRSRRPAIGRFDIVLRLRGRCDRARLSELGSEAARLLDTLMQFDTR